MPRQTRQTKPQDPVVKLLPKRKRPAPVSAAGEGESSEDIDETEAPVTSSSKSAKRLNARAKPPEHGESVKFTPFSKESNGYTREASELNLLKRLDLIQFGTRHTRRLQLKMIQNHFVDKSIKQLTEAGFEGRFSRRITALTWHEKYPYVLASASKFGDIMLISAKGSNETGMEQFVVKAEVEGGGAGYSITAMKFHNQDMNILYRASIDCSVARVDLAHGETVKYHDTGDYNNWFCGLDVNFAKNMIVAGDNKGTAYQFSIDGKLLSRLRLHKNKIHHIEFSKMDSNLMVTSTLEKNEGVRIWDIRCLKESLKHSDFTPLKSLPHACGLNCAKFSPLDGSRLLTSDQKDEIRIYQGPLWEDYLTINHHHKQFQHITPIKAGWHPVNDYIVIGRYPPKASHESQKQVRAIEFFDSYSGKLVDQIYPPLDEICSLNEFNPTGEYLATGMNSKLILWKPGNKLDVAENSKPLGGESAKNLSKAMRNVLRGRTTREFSPASDGEDDDDDEDKATDKKKRARTASNVKGKAATSTTNPTNTKNRKKK